MMCDFNAVLTVGLELAVCLAGPVKAEPVVVAVVVAEAWTVGLAASCSFVVAFDLAAAAAAGIVVVAASRVDSLERKKKLKFNGS